MVSNLRTQPKNMFAVMLDYRKYQNHHHDIIKVSVLICATLNKNIKLF